ncbi:MAG: MarR family transcriptional regulator [Desulfotignum sp.]|nr:MarR family transcriptional regulator [Desulfotignum sp.]
MSGAVISDISRCLIEIAWHLGPKGINGECCENLTMPEFIALDKIFTTPNCPVQDVGYSLKFTKSGATRIVNRLEKKGYVNKIRSMDDARVCCVKLTKKGLRVLESTDARYLKQFEDMIAGMPEQSVSHVIQVIFAMAKSLKNGVPIV